MPARRPSWMRLAVAFAFTTLWTRGLSLSVTGGSPCESACKADNGPTVADDLICSDSDYNSTAGGLAMKKCLLCESTSTTYINWTDNDVFWFLYNQKYTVQHCLFEGDEESLTSCGTDCRPLQSVFLDIWWPDRNKPPTQHLYDYCTMNNDAFGEHWKRCTDCMRGKDESFILGNFISNMAAGCRTKPNASEGGTVDMRHPLFITEYWEGTKTTSTSASSTATSKSEETSAESGSSGSTSSSLSADASAGVGVGVAVGVILMALLAWLLFRRHRRQHQQPQQQQGEMSASQYPVQGVYDNTKHELDQSYPQRTVVNEAEGTPRSELQAGTTGVTRVDTVDNYADWSSK